MGGTDQKGPNQRENDMYEHIADVCNRNYGISQSSHSIFLFLVKISAGNTDLSGLLMGHLEAQCVGC